MPSPFTESLRPLWGSSFHPLSIPFRGPRGCRGPPLRRRLRRFNIGRVMRALAILCVVPGFSLGLIAGVTHLVGPLEPGSAQPTNLVWSNRVFTTRRDFGSWLVSRGSNYELWSQRHPVALHHFDDVSRRSLAASASAQDSRRQAQSGAALPIAIISCAVLLAMLALPRFVRSARFLLKPRSTGLRLRGPPWTILASFASRSHAGARAPRRTQATARPRSALIQKRSASIGEKAGQRWAVSAESLPAGPPSPPNRTRTWCVITCRRWPSMEWR